MRYKSITKFRLLIFANQKIKTMKNYILCLCVFSTLLTSCVSTKKYKAQVAKYDTLKTDYDKVNLQLSACLDDRNKQSAKISSLETELAHVKENSTNLLTQLSTLSVITTEQSESIKKSLENLNSKDAYIMDLQKEMARKDSLNMALVLNLKGALKDVNDEDVQIKVEGSVVFISISDKMLFKSGSYQITPRAKEVLGKVADVVK